MNKRKNRVLLLLLITLSVLCAICMYVGSSNMSFNDFLLALLKKSSSANNRIIYNIRLPRIIAAIVAGASLALSGLIMQTVLNNQMASPSTLGVSNAAVFGANLSIIVFAGGFLNTGHNINNYGVGANPYYTSLIAFGFALISILLILGLCRTRSFTPGVVVLAGIAIGSIFQAATTLVQFFATDVGISAAVVWNFGDLGRATYKTDLIMFLVFVFSLIVFVVNAWKYNALLSGDGSALSMGVDVKRLRFVSLLLSSLLCAVCVSFLGIIGFVGIICPHVIKKLIGEDHRYSIISSAMAGSILLLFADSISRGLGPGVALPVGAITSLLGAPFFLSIIFSKKRGGRC